MVPVRGTRGAYWIRCTHSARAHAREPEGAALAGEMVYAMRRYANGGQQCARRTLCAYAVMKTRYAWQKRGTAENVLSEQTAQDPPNPRGTSRQQRTGTGNGRGTGMYVEERHVINRRHAAGNVQVYATSPRQQILRAKWPLGSRDSKAAGAAITACANGYQEER